MAPVEEPSGGAGGEVEDDKAGGLGAGSSSYVPPHLRGKAGAAGGEKMGGRFEKDDLATLRVTNVREDDCVPTISGFYDSLPITCGFANYSFTTNRSANWQRKTSYGICSNDLAVSPEFSWLGTEKPREPRALLSSVMRTGAMLNSLATKWTAVSS